MHVASRMVAEHAPYYKALAGVYICIILYPSYNVCKCIMMCQLPYHTNFPSMLEFLASEETAIRTSLNNNIIL